MPDVNIDARLDSILSGVDWQGVASSATGLQPVSSQGQTIGGDVEAGLQGAAEGAVVAAVVGEAAYAVGAAIVLGDVAAGVGAAVGAAAAIGAAYGPIGAAVGAVIGVLIAVFGKPGPTAFQTRPFEGTNPILVFKAIVLNDAPRLCIEAMQDQATAIALCTWSATDDFTTFDKWLVSFCTVDKKNSAVKRLCKYFETHGATDAEIDAFARVASVIMFARSDAALQPGDDQAIQVINALQNRHYALTVSNVQVYQATTSAIHKMRDIGIQNRPKGKSMSSAIEQNLAHGYTHLYCEIDEYGHEGPPMGLTYRQAQTCVQAAFGTSIGAEDRKAGVLRPIDPLGKYGPRTQNPPPMLPLSSLTLSLLQDEAFHTALLADIAAGHNQNEPLPSTLHLATIAALNPDIMLTAIKGGLAIHNPITGLAVAVTHAQPTWFERMLEWIEHLLHIGPHPHALEQARNPGALVQHSDDAPTGYRPLIPRAVRGGVFGHTLENGDEVLDESDYAQHSGGMSEEDRIQMWLSDPVRSTVAFDLNDRHIDEDCINSVFDDPQSSPELAEAFSCIEQQPDSCPIAAIALRLVRMKRDCEAAVARACAGDTQAKEYVRDMVNRGGVLGRMASDYLILSELQPLQAKALQRPMSLAPQLYPSA